MTSQLKHSLTLLLIAVVWTAWPIACVLAASLLARLGNAKLDEGSVHPCIILGHDFGRLAYSLGVMGWFMLLTVPTGVLFLLVILVKIVLELLRSARG